MSNTNLVILKHVAGKYAYQHNCYIPFHFSTSCEFKTRNIDGRGSEKMESVGDREEKMEGHCSTGQSPQWAVVPMEEEEY